ncbi:hypothetical protein CHINAEXTREME_12655 [Halobiforma lacisalsi AJ5]|uniref:DUF7836 domain-containing protein n=2 Tax=Natronobacterium TaxID=2256 RepID=A0A1P8LS31_NATLA|nr:MULTISPECIES: hypothetical protein [Halobiforma]APW98573.1 hypothetical protein CHINAEXTREME_12655 [Halobiforma lacisalsi AJ5]SFC37113.1 hypothetical protein SAMN05444422_107243 [Halobiforma haloterrestris]
MDETTVQLLCPECAKDWQTAPGELPESTAMFHCPNCHASRRMAEFMRTDRDLQTLKQLG